MRTRNVLSIVSLMVSVLTIVPAALAQDIPAEYEHVLAYLGRKGDFSDGVLKVGIARNDLKVSVAGVATPTSFGFGGWLGFTKGDKGMDVMMGDLVLLQEEVNPVMSALLDNGLEVTALHNHFFWEEPRIFYMHVHGHGTAADLARMVKPALDLIGHVAASTTSGGAPTSGMQANTGIAAGNLDGARIDAIVGHKGDLSGGVYKVTVGRPDIVLNEMGARIGTRMGLNSWAAIVGSNDRAAIAGDIAMKENEVTGVLKALRSNGLDVVAIHHHMTGTRPMVIFLHYWGTGPVSKLAGGFKAAIAELGK